MLPPALSCTTSTPGRSSASSAEAELAACIKASCEGIGVAQMAESLGRQVEVEVYVDSSAALGVVDRKGNGKLRHIRVGQLWIQQAAEDETITYRKIHGKENPADLCTKHLTQTEIDRALTKIELVIREGRAQEEWRTTYVSSCENEADLFTKVLPSGENKKNF